MKKAVVIGGRGKVGSYLVPMLVKSGYAVTNVSRGKTVPKIESDTWESVEQLTFDRSTPSFNETISSLSADVIVDMICFESDDLKRLAGTLNGNTGHYLVCGSCWMHGKSGAVPVLEDECRNPLEHYGEQKSQIDYAITDLYKKDGFPGTAVHPGHIVCPGDIPINPQGFKSLSAFETLKAGEPLYLPNFGMETLHHVHAEDVAGVFFAAINTGKPSFGEGFHAVSPRAVTLHGYATEVASWFNKVPDLRYEPFDVFKNRVDEFEAAGTYEHIQHSPNCSMEKALRTLNFTPRHTSYEAIRECIASFGLL